MRLAIRWSSVAVAAMLLAPSAHALKYTTKFIEFELPNNWKCIHEGGNWYCDSEDPTKKRDGALVMAAKLKGPLDSLKDYEDHLKSPRKYRQNDKDVISQSKYVFNKTINGQVWIDSMHVDSEVPGFFTHYLATIKEDVGILVSWSIDKKKYPEYEKQFDALIASIRVFRQPKTAPLAGGPDITAPAMVSGNGIFGKVDGDTGAAPVGTIKNKPAAESGGGGLLMLLLLLAAGGGGFFIWKKKQQSGG